MSNLCVFSSGHNTDLARKSCERVGIDLQIYPREPFTNFFDIKVRGAFEFLMNRPEEYAMWIDCHDSLVLKPEAVILGRLKIMDAGVVIGGELNCYPEPSWAGDYKYLSNDLLFICAGGWVGKRGDIIRLLDVLLKNPGSAGGGNCDQRAWSRCFLDGLMPGLIIDHPRQFFASMCDGAEIAMKGDACVAHFNGHVAGREEMWERVCTA